MSSQGIGEAATADPPFFPRPLRPPGIAAGSESAKEEWWVNERIFVEPFFVAITVAIVLTSSLAVFAFSSFFYVACCMRLAIPYGVVGDDGG